MPFYRLTRHVIYSPQCQDHVEVWGIDRPAKHLKTVGAPRDTDAEDPLNDCGDCCTLLLRLCDGYVTWDRMMEFLSVAEEAGYEVISGFKNMSPFQPILLRGP